MTQFNTFNTDAFANTAKTAVAEFSALANTAFAGFHKLAEFNLATAKESLAGSLDSVEALVSVKSPQDLLAVQSALIKPLAEKAATYGRTVYEIASQTQAELSKAAEGRFADGQKSVEAAVAAMTKNAPAGSEAMVAAIKSAFSTSQQVMQQAQAAAKQALAQAEANATKATDAAVKSAKMVAKI
jgi:phasin family protein